MGETQNTASAIAEQSAALREQRRREALNALLNLLADRSAREIEALCHDLEQRYVDRDRAEAIRELTAAAAVFPAAAIREFASAIRPADHAH